MTLIFDTSALIALERNDRASWQRLKSAFLASEIPITHGGAVGQAWRIRLARGSSGKGARRIDVKPLDEDLGRRAGELLARAKKSDVIDAAIVLLASDGDAIVTSDAGDLETLARAAGRVVDLIEV